MNIFAMLLGAAAVKHVTDYPQEIRELKSKIPKSDRDAVLQQYKKLPGQAKTDFKTALKNADMAAASQILGQDLTKYNIAMSKTGKDEQAKTTAAQMDQPALTPESDFAARIDKILAVPTSIDPELVAEAAKRYEAAVPRYAAGNISDKTQKLIELNG